MQRWRKSIWLRSGLVAVLPLFVVSVSHAAAGLEWKAQSAHREASVILPASGKTGFTSMKPAESGIFFTNVLSSERGLTNQLLYGGAGVACGDIDGDGWCDLYFCGLDSTNTLYRNLGGWKFEDVTRTAGVSCAGQTSTGATFADVDGDGDLDLLVTSFGGGTRLFINDGKGRFTETTKQAGLLGGSTSLSMALADVDGDGDLDLYVANYRPVLLQDQPELEIRISTTNNQPFISTIGGRPATPADLQRFNLTPGGAILENGEPDVLYLNDGRGNFKSMSLTDGSFLDEDGNPAPVPLDWGLSVMFRDMNGDGAPDIYVCNDMDSIDRIWINNGAGKFRAIPRLALRRTCLASMGIDFADLNRDGLDDFLVVDMLASDHRGRHTLMAARTPFQPPGRIENRPQYMRNTLFLNRGDGTYSEIAQMSGLEATDWSWMPVFLDVDLDGYEDVLVTTGIERSFRDADARQQTDLSSPGKKLTRREFFDLRRSIPKLDNPNHAYRNRGDLTFEETSAAWGFDSHQTSQGMALADLDNDGDLDVVINCMNAPALLYRNDSMAPRMAVRLKGSAPNTRGIGAKIKVFGGPMAQSQEMICAGRYLSSDDAVRVFAAGKATNNLSIEVTWRSGKRSVIAGLKPNQIIEVDEAVAKPAPVRQPSALDSQPFFKEVSQLLRHRHHEDEYNDFTLQPLLPKRFSRLGPGVCWFDFNGDRLDDLLIGSGHGGGMGIYSNDGKGGFVRVDATELLGRLTDDQTTILAWRLHPQVTSLFMAVAAYESGVTNYPAVLRLNLSGEGFQQAEPLPMAESSAGPMALADVDGDGGVEIFVGGRVNGGRYPEPASSRMYHRVAGKFELMDTPQFNKVGLVSGAVFSDLNGDGRPDLVLACEWGPLRVFRNEEGKLVEATDALGLGKFTGWWNSVTTGDFDGDGRMDIVAGNWGRNTKYQRHAGQPLRVYYGDLEHDGLMKVVEGHFEASMGKIVPWRHLDSLALGLPFVHEKFPTFTAYSEAGVQDILGEYMKEMTGITATMLDSMVFLNRGDHFAAVPLPLDAQLSPIFGLCAGDLDGDGREDIFASQNFFAVDAETARYDGGRSVWLKGDGRGGFASVPGQESGLLIYGEGRGAALCDYDGDGRVDVVAAQNGAETKLYHNEMARPGLRVRLFGTGGNVMAAGASMRVVDAGGKWGPAREIHAGSGYWSQDSPVQVVAAPVEGGELQVRWPGGKATQAAIPKGAKEIAVYAAGNVEVLR